LQKAKIQGVEIFVREHFIRETANATIRSQRAKPNREQLVGEGLELRRSGVREARAKILLDARGEDRGHKNVWFSGVGKKSREAITERKWPDPEVKPESRGGAIADENFRSEAKGGEARRDIFPNGSVEVVGIPLFLEGDQPYCRLNQQTQGAEELECILERNLARSAEFWAEMERTPRPPFSVGTQTSSQATLHWPPLQVSSPAQKKARLRLSIAETTPGGRIPAAMAWATIAVRTELTRISLLPMGRDRPRHPERRISLLDMMGAKSESRSLWVERGRPR
jgi:hypothetical protein